MQDAVLDLIRREARSAHHEESVVTEPLFSSALCGEPPTALAWCRYRSCLLHLAIPDSALLGGRKHALRG